MFEYKMNIVYPTNFSAWLSFENRNASGWKFNYTQTFAETHQKCVWIFNDATLWLSKRRDTKSLPKTN